MLKGKPSLCHNVTAMREHRDWRSVPNLWIRIWRLLGHFLHVQKCAKAVDNVTLHPASGYSGRHNRFAISWFHPLSRSLHCYASVYYSILFETASFYFLGTSGTLTVLYTNLQTAQLSQTPPILHVLVPEHLFGVSCSIYY
jgi:hypothetical protein